MIKKINRKTDEVTKLTNLVSRHHPQVMADINAIVTIDWKKYTTPNITMPDVVNPDLKNLKYNLYRKLALVTHPDKTPISDDFFDIKTAYECDNLWQLIQYAESINFKYR